MFCDVCIYFDAIQFISDHHEKLYKIIGFQQFSIDSKNMNHGKRRSAAMKAQLSKFINQQKTNSEHLDLYDPNILVESDSAGKDCQDKWISLHEANRIKSRIISLLIKNSMDINKRIDFAQFVEMIRLYFHNTTEQRLKQIFMAFDDDNDDYIIFNELFTESNFPKFLKFC